MQTLSPTAVRIARSLFAFVGVLAPLTALVRIVRSSVNVPYTDEWDWTQLAVAGRTGKLTWDALWVPHNGHRQIVSNLLFVAIDRLGGWNVVREELVGLAIVIAGLIALNRLVTRTLPPLAGAAAFAVFCWLIAGPIAYENFLIGWQMSWQMCVAAVLIVVERLSAPGAGRGHVLLAGGAAVLASFSMAIGLAIWPCGFVVMIGERAPRRMVIAWCALWAVTVIAYFAGYAYDAGPALRARSLSQAFSYALTFMGTPLRSAEMSLEMLQGIGALLVLAFILAAVAAWRSRMQPADYWPWVALGAYALCGALLTALTRSAMGAYQAQSPRYVSISQFLIVAICGLAIPRALALRRVVWRAAAALVAAVFVVSLARSVELGWIVWRDYDYHRGVELQGIARNDRATMSESYPDPVRLATYLDMLRTVDDGPLDEK